MTNQQKIEFYLSKGFAVEVEWDDKEKAKIYHIDSNGNMLAVDNKGMANIFESCFFASIKSITPILPNPYEFSVGERVIIVKTGKTFEVYTRVGLDGKYGDGFGNSYYWYQLAPALPEDEECEVVEVIDDGIFVRENGVFTFTKPDGKKLKIRVIKQ
jgi:hypothetical protein